MNRGYLIDHSGTLAAGTSQTLITQTVAARSFFMFQNLGTHPMYIQFGASPAAGVPTAVAGQPSIKIQPSGTEGDTIIFDHQIPQGSVAVIGTSGDAFVCKEMA